MTPLLRPGRPGDHPFVIDSWLNANKGTPRAREMLAAGIYWTEYKAIVRRLLASKAGIPAEVEPGFPDTVLTIACDPDDEDAILGWACTSEPPPGNPDPLVHYVYVRGKRPNSARRLGIAKLLLAEFLPHPCTYTHRPAKAGVPIPEHWQWNSERIYR